MNDWDKKERREMRERRNGTSQSGKEERRGNEGEEKREPDPFFDPQPDPAGSMAFDAILDDFPAN